MQSQIVNRKSHMAIPYDGEGAPLLRPLARLTSFGGYVATGGTRSRASVATMPFSVERELDPPASASGRRELRPSRDTWRWRPRHRICQPPSRNQSIPAQRTTTGASSPRQIRKCPDGQTQSQAENHGSQIPTASCQLPTANWQLQKAKGDAPRASPPDTGGASDTHTLVEVAGFEPATSCLQSRRSTS